MGNLPDPKLLPEFYAFVLPKRLVAWAVDGVLILLLTVLVVVATAFVALAIAPVLAVAINVAYRYVGLVKWSATPGMALMAVELRDARGERLDSATALFHTLIYTGASATVILQVVSVVMMLTSDRRQGLPDVLLGTAMLNRPRD